jgi:hypothetical protein
LCVAGIFYALALINNVQRENGVAGYVFRHMMQKEFDWCDALRSPLFLLC